MLIGFNRRTFNTPICLNPFELKFISCSRRHPNNAPNPIEPKNIIVRIKDVFLQQFSSSFPLQKTQHNINIMLSRIQIQPKKEITIYFNIPEVR